MAYRDAALDIRRGVTPVAIGQGAGSELMGAAQAINRDIGDVTASITTRASQARDDDFEPAEFAMNAKTGEIALPNGKVIKANAPTILQLATLTNDDGKPLPRMANVPAGFRPISQAKMKAMVDAIPTESDFWGEAFANGKTTLGLAASFVDSLIGNDDPSNEWSRAAQNLENDQSIGQVKAGRGRWYSSFDSFLSGLGQTAGNVGGTVLGAAPVIAAGTGIGALGGGGVGAVPGAALSAGFALSGGASAYGEQATEFYDSAIDALSKMDQAQLEVESPQYRQILAENPEITHEEAIKELAIRGARMAGTAAGALGAAEGIVGGKLAGNFLARMGVSKSLLGPVMDAVAKRTGVGATVARVGTRTALGGAGAALEEMAETAFGQAAGAATTGVGSTNPMDYVDPEEGWAASLGGGLFGALGGRARATPTEVARNSAIGESLQVNPDVNQPQNLSSERTDLTDLVPAALRRDIGAREMQPGPAAPAPDQRLMVKAQLENLLAERFGPGWPDEIDAIAGTPQGRQIVAQLIAIEQDMRAEQEQPAYERGYGQGPVDAGTPDPGTQGALFGMGPREPAMAPPVNPAEQGAMQDPNQQMLPLVNDIPVNQPDVAPPGPSQPNLRERRAAQDLAQQDRAAASAANPQALPQSDVSALEQQILQLDDQLGQLDDQIAQRKARAPRDVRLKPLRAARKQLADQIAELEAQHEALMQQGEQAPVAGTVDAPEPLAAPEERMPDGRPVGVAPTPLENPIPMSPEEAQSRAQTQQKRRGKASAPAAATPAAVEAAAAASEQQVSPSTAEPAQDINAQIDAMMDPASDRDAVFVAEQKGATSPLPVGIKMTPKGAVRVERPGIGILITTSPKKAQLFRRAKRDADIQKILGYSENKADVIKAGSEPVVVQAVTPKGAVAAEQLATKKGVPVAKKTVAKLGPKGAKVVTTSIAKTQARREEASKPKKATKREAKDDDETRVGPEDRSAQTRAEREVTRSRVSRETAAPAAAAADTVERATSRQAESVAAKGKTVALPTRLTRQSGLKGKAVDLRAEALDEEAQYALGMLLDNGTLSARDREKAEAAQTAFDQIGTMLDASVEAAEERLRPVMEAEGQEFSREAERKQLEVEQKASAGERGRPRERPRTSPIAYLPLTVRETRGFLQALREEAKHESGTYQPATSVVRHMINAIAPDWQTLLEHDSDGKRVVKVFASLTDEQIEDVLQRTQARVADSTVAKQVMRGATEVAHAMRRAEQDLSGMRRTLEDADHLPGDSDVQPHATEHGTVPDAAKGLVNSWVRLFEKGGNKFSAPIHVMSIKDAMKIEPKAFLNGRVPNGKFIRRADAKGNTTEYILAMDWNRFKFEGAAVEVLAHEFGHMVTYEAYGRSSPLQQKAIDRAYERWLALQQGRSIDDILKDQMPGFEKATFKGGATNRAYATDFWEWSARNAAVYILDPNRKAFGPVERFFKTIAEIMRKVYEVVRGGTPDPTWAEMLDRWADGSMRVNPLPQVPSTFYDHDEFGDGREAADNPSLRAIAKNATQALAPIRQLFSGGATTEEVQAAMAPLTKGKAMDVLKGLGLSLETMRQIERQYRDTPLGPALSGWVRNQQRKSKTANVAMERGSRVVERALQLDARVREVLEQVMYEATSYGIHPELPFTHADNAHLLRGSDMVKKVNEERYNGLRAKWDAMTAADAKSADIYVELREAMNELHKNTLQKLLENVQAMNISDGAKKQIVERIENAQRELREGPYFPLMRQGNWIVTVQLPAHVVGQGGKVNSEPFDSKTAAREEMRNQKALNPGAQVSVEKIPDEPGKYYVRVFQKGMFSYESEAEALAAKAEILDEVKARYKAMNVDFDDAQAAVEKVTDEDGSESDALISQPFKARDDYAQSKRATPEFTQEVRSLLNQNQLDPEVAATLERLAIEALPENSYRHALLPRRNVMGASKRMIESYSHRYQGGAHHYANVEHGKQINDNWARAWEINREYSPAGRVLNTLASNQRAIAERMSNTPLNRAMNMATDLSSTFSLGFNPAYVLANATQPSVVTIPVLAGQVNPRTGKSVGMIKATKYMKEAYAGAIPFFTKRGFNDFINETKALMGKRGSDVTLQETAQEIIGKFGQTDEEKAMLQSLLERGTLDFSWLNSLEDAMRGGKLSQKWANIQRLGMALPQQVEAMNRVTTALAAYRLAKDENLTDGTEAALQEFADDTVAETQLDYSRMNRPLAFNKAGLNVILQFKLYMQGIYMLFARQATLAMRGKTPEERKQGRRTFAYLMATHAAAAGAAGLGPIAGLAKLALVAGAAMGMGDDDDKWKSGEQLMKEMLTDVFGEYGGQVAGKGVAAIAGIDMSDRIGIPNLYDSRFSGTRESDSTSQGMDKILAYSMGAPYSNLKRVAQGVSDLANGDARAAVNGLPAAARSLARSVKWANEGIVSKDGDTFVPRDDLNWRDLAINSLGLTPINVSTRYNERSELKGTTARYATERKRLMMADRNGEDVDDEIKAFNSEVPKPFRISGEQRQQSHKMKKEREGGAVRKEEAAVKKILGQ